MKILHIIPRWIGGGPERGILEACKHDHAQPETIERKVLVLDKPVSAPLFIMARRLGITVLADLTLDQLASEIDAADIVEVAYWNHPLLLDLLRCPLPPSRLLIRSAIAGNTLPHILFPDLVAFADSWVLSAPPGHGSSSIVHDHCMHLPDLADMARLATFARRSHRGVRIGYLGSIAPTKLHPGFADIIAATSDLDTRFDLFGDADAATLAALRQALESRQMLHRVALHGHVENISEAFSEIDIFAYPLTPGSYVTSEKALQEAMWIGLPPVLMTGTAATGWIEHGVTGFIAKDSAEFAATLNRLAVDPDLRHRIGSAARNYARQRFEPSFNAAALGRFQSELASRAKRQRRPIRGAGQSPANRFLQSLGDTAAIFLQLVKTGRVHRSHHTILNLDILLRGEGGLLHYANTYPADELLRNWSTALQDPQFVGTIKRPDHANELQDE